MGHQHGQWAGRVADGSVEARMLLDSVLRATYWVMVMIVIMIIKSNGG